MSKEVGKIADDQIDLNDDDVNLEGDEGTDDEGGEGEGADAGSQDDDTAESPEIKKLREQAAQSGAKAEEYRLENEKLKGEKKQAVDAQFAQAEVTLDSHERENATSIEAANAAIAELKKQKKEALDSGDNEAVVALDDKIMDKKQDIRGLEFQKTQIADAKVKLKDIKEKQLKAPQQEERSAGDAQLTPAAKAWVDKNPRFNTDAEYQAEAIGAHEVAVRKGIKVDSPAYFKFIEDRLAKAFPDDQADDGDDGAEDNENQGDAEPPKKKPIKNPQSFGASGGSGQNAGGTPRKKIGQLTAAEVEAAEISGMTAKEYWEFKYGSKAPKKE